MQTITVSAPFGTNPDNLYSAISTEVGGPIGKGVVKVGPDSVTIEFTEMSVGRDGMVYSNIAESQGSTLDALKNAMVAFQATITLPPALSTEQLHALRKFSNAFVSTRGEPVQKGEPDLSAVDRPIKVIELRGLTYKKTDHSLSKDEAIAIAGFDPIARELIKLIKKRDAVKESSEDK